MRILVAFLTAATVVVTATATAQDFNGDSLRDTVTGVPGQDVAGIVDAAGRSLWWWP